MKIAICDDELVAREQITTFVEDYCIERGVDIGYEVFESYVPLENRIDEFDAFIMDYQTPEIDGMSFAGIIREKYGNTKTIIFVTSFREIVYDAFTVKTHRFIVKPVEKEKLFEALDSYINDKSDGKNLIIKADGFTDIIKATDIYFIEVRGKDCCVHLEDDERIIRRSISSLEDELAEAGFFRIHRNYIVNMRKIKSFDKSKAELINNQKIEISSRKYSAFCKEYLKLK